MDTRYLEYFVEIVNCQYNLSAAAKKLSISQPVLSARVKQFEEEEGILLFERYNGRLQKLTPGGEIFYQNALRIVAQYNTMLYELRDKARTYKGKVRIGIPPLVLSVVFFECLPKLVLENPDIEFEIVELGAHDLKSLLVSKNLDFAVLLHPIDLSPGLTEEYPLITSELTAFLSVKNPLAQQTVLAWEQLNGQSLATFNDTFMIYHHLTDKLKAMHVHPNICLRSACWDFLLLATKNENIISILPAPIEQVIKMPDVVARPLETPIPWTIVLHRPKKSRYSRAEQHVMEVITAHFASK